MTPPDDDTLEKLSHHFFDLVAFHPYTKDETIRRMAHTLREVFDAVARESSPPVAVAGYTAQPPEKVELVNRFKIMEERILREIDKLYGSIGEDNSPAYELRWVSVAKTHFQEGFMCLNRSVFQPSRISLPEDEGRQGE